ncbi:MAG: SprB repeat-containing protein [Bacteroidetes bacterium]|nr:SprB repeat-containing protein [Bacteroidota bacterium]
MTDGNGCTATLSIAIAEPLALVLSETYGECYAIAATGTIDLTVSGGTLPYGYNWSNGSTTEDNQVKCWHLHGNGDGRQRLHGDVKHRDCRAPSLSLIGNPYRCVV